MVGIAKKKKKTGRKPYPADRKRVRVGCRVHPETNKFLKELSKRLDAGHQSLGRAIDYVVDLVKDAGIDPFENS